MLQFTENRLRSVGLSVRALVRTVGLATSTNPRVRLNAIGLQGPTGAAGSGVTDGDKGDITVSSSGAVWTIDDTAVTNAKLSNMAQATFKMRASGAGTGAPIDGTATQAKAALGIAISDTTGTVPPDRGGTGVANNSASTITVTGSFGTTFTVAATTSVALPTSGTLATLAGAEELTNKTLTSSVGKGTWTTSGTWTLPAFTLGGTVSSNGQSFSGTIANLGSVTTADINGGTVDGTVIGGSSAAAGTFTTGTFTTSITDPLLIGGTGAGSTLTLQSTSGNGSSDAIIFQVGNNGATAGGRFDTTGRLILRHTASLSPGGITDNFQTSGGNNFLGVYAFSSSNSNEPGIRFYRSNSNTIGSATVVASGDTLGGLYWQGAQQTGTFSNANTAASIRCLIDGTVTSGAGADMPGRIVFATTADGAGIATDRLILDSAGVLKPATNDIVALGTTSLSFSDLFLAPGGVINWNSGNATLTHSAALLTSNVNIAVPDDAYDATTWNGSTNVPTKNAVRDKIESLGSGSFPSVTASFRAHKNGTDQTGITGATPTTVTLGTEAFDVGAHFASNAWTPPAGKVHIAGAVQFAGTFTLGAFIYASIYKDGAEYETTVTQATSTSFGMVNIECYDDASGSNVYTLIAYGEVASGTLTVDGRATRTWFAGSLI